MDTKIQLSNNCLYICHFCLYKTTKRCDMQRHIDKKIKCQLTYIPYKIIGYEESANLSLNKRFFILFDYKSLLLQDYIFIVNTYHEKMNYVKYDEVMQNNKFLKNKIESIKESVKESIKENNTEEYDNSENSEEDEEDKKFECIKCFKKYKYKKDLLKHYKNTSICESNQLLNKVLKETNNKNISEIIESGKKIQQNINNISNSFNQNHLSIQNNYNSSPTIKLEVKDFGRESYSCSHIPNSFIKQDDFYLYTNFLNKILENEVNQNILFIPGNEDVKSENRKAIIYADEKIYKITEDKAIFMIMQKLNMAMKNMISIVYKSDEDKEKIDEIERYYRVITGHFKHDTIYKNYHIDDKQFYHLSHKRRSRDVYTSNIKSIVNNYGTPLSHIENNTMNSSTLEMFNPDIEDYASTRVRNKDLKKRKDEMLF